VASQESEERNQFKQRSLYKLCLAFIPQREPLNYIKQDNDRVNLHFGRLTLPEFRK
jgi:hypothetical protein